ncbi:MAG: RNA-binding protein [Gammaproteobacteria bacterium]|nr:RNA-binding protein [Gammaproteobacteria bacterium]
MWLFGGDGDDEGMDVFIGNLPDKTSVEDLQALLGEYAEDASLKFSNKLFTDGSTINFCVVSFRSSKVAKKAIKAIQHKKMGGEYLSIHEFSYRSYHNDRRLNPYSPIHEDDGGNDSRHQERRRKEKIVDPFEPEAVVEEKDDETKIRVSGYDAFARKG